MKIKILNCREVICTNCNKYYIRMTKCQYENNYCCLECEKEYKHKQKWEFRKCEICNENFECKKISTQRFCSSKCKNNWQSAYLRGELANNYNKNYSVENRSIICGWCTNSFLVIPSEIGKAKFCSSKCRQEWYTNIYSQTEERKSKSRKNAIEILEKGYISKTNTEPQKVVNKFLDNLNIKYINEKGFNYCTVDNYLYEHNLIIEVMGTYWHTDNRFYTKINYAMQVNRIRMDKIKNKNIYNDYNIHILYLWEYDILNNKNMCIELIKKYINCNGILNNYHSFNYQYNNKLLLSQNIIIPYMNWDIQNLNNIVNICTKEKMSKKQKDKWITFNCEFCGNEKEELICHYNKNKHHYCNVSCMGKDKIQKIKVKCNNCNLEIEVIPHKIKTNKYFFCNQKCQFEYQQQIGFKRNGGVIEFNCDNCGNLTQRKTGDYNKNKHHFCSKKCNYIFKKKK